jgi:hypothetical protein
MYVKGRYRTPQGIVASEGQRDATGIKRFDVTVPANTTVTVYLPGVAFRPPGGADPRHLADDDGRPPYDVAPGQATSVPWR